MGWYWPRRRQNDKAVMHRVFHILEYSTDRLVKQEASDHWRLSIWSWVRCYEDRCWGTQRHQVQAVNDGCTTDRNYLCICRQHVYHLQYITTWINIKEEKQLYLLPCHARSSSEWRMFNNALQDRRNLFWNDDQSNIGTEEARQRSPYPLWHLGSRG